MLLDFVMGPADESVFGYSKVSYHEIKPSLLYDKIDIAICCNENATDWEIHDFIVATDG